MSTDQYHDRTSRRAPVIRLWTSVLLGYTALGASIQALPGWLQLRLGSSESFVAVAIGVAFAATALGRPFAGWAGDCGAGKLVVVSGGALTVIGALGQFTAASSGLVLISRLVMGAGEAAIFSGALPWVLGGADPARRGRVAGWFGMSMWSGLAVGPVLAAAAGHIGPRMPWFLILLLGAACAAVAMAAPRPRGGRFSGFSRLALWPAGIGKPAVVFGLGAYGYGTISATLVLYLSHGTGGEQSGLAVFAGAFLLVRMVGSQAVDRYGGAVVLPVTLTVEAVGLLCLATLGSTVGIFVGVALTGSGCSLLFPAVVDVALGRVPGGLPGVGVAAATSMWDLGLLLAGVLSGVLVALFGYAAAYAGACGSALLAIAVAGSLTRDGRDGAGMDSARVRDGTTRST